MDAPAEPESSTVDDDSMPEGEAMEETVTLSVKMLQDTPASFSGMVLPRSMTIHDLKERLADESGIPAGG
jgi:hypothetical protein